MFVAAVFAAVREGIGVTGNYVCHLLLKENILLPFAGLCMLSKSFYFHTSNNMYIWQFSPLDELTVSQDQAEKADMRIVQASSQEVLSKHNHILSRGLMVDLPSIQQVLDGEISVIKCNTKQTFLTDFIESKADTPGNRLARYEI